MGEALILLPLCYFPISPFVSFAFFLLLLVRARLVASPKQGIVEYFVANVKVIVDNSLSWVEILTFMDVIN